MNFTAALSLTAVAGLLLSSCNVLSTAPTAPTGTLAYGLTGTSLVTFGTGNAPESAVTRPLTGLPSGETLVDLDMRNTDNRLYAVAASGAVYVLNPATGALTADGASVKASTRAVDFNPTANRLRVVGASTDNYRLTLNSAPVPAASPAGTVTADGTFAYLPTDPNAGKTPTLSAAAYTNAFNDSAGVPSTATTALYSLDAGTDALILHSVGPQFNTIATQAALGVDIGAGTTGFDIAGASTAFMTSSNGTDTTLYSVNLSATTGSAATPVATLKGTALKALALHLPSR